MFILYSPAVRNKQHTKGPWDTCMYKKSGGVGK